ncbi:MAG: hypothetical protein NVSMB48_24790 [Marmoricola sp.]
MNEGDHATPLSTGHAGVDEAMAAIGALGDADLATHVATFERAHDVLREALNASDEEDVAPIPEA